MCWAMATLCAGGLSLPPQRFYDNPSAVGIKHGPHAEAFLIALAGDSQPQGNL